MVKKYEGEKRYILETTYGCYSGYGRTYACAGDTFDDGKIQYDHWSKTGGQYRLIDNETGEVILGDNT